MILQQDRPKANTIKENYNSHMPIMQQSTLPNDKTFRSADKGDCMKSCLAVS
jgi:hypothetical protein